MQNIYYCEGFFGWPGEAIQGVVPESNNFCDDSAASDFDGITWDLDGNGTADALTDGLLLLRHTFGITGSSLTTDAISSNSPLSNEEVVTKVEGVYQIADIDNNGSVDALTDGLIVLRYLFGLTGNFLTEDVVANNGTRTDAVDIEAYLQSKMP